MDNRLQKEFDMINAGIPEHIKRGLMKRENDKDAQKMKEMAHYALSKATTRQQKETLKKMINEPITQYDVVDPVVQKELDLYLSTKVAKLKKKFPVQKNDPFLQMMRAKMGR